uniref:Structure-specific endonuclease subunit SLX4 n=1 Tax=Anopheles stephensi TaxID=30069 RepID=A0A182XZ47_ANOST
MSKRLKFAKLRLAKPNDVGAPPPGVVPAESIKYTLPRELNGSVLISLLLLFSTNSTVSGKTSKYFTNGVENPCAEEETFIMIHSEDSGEDNQPTKEQSSRRRPQKSPNACPSDGPKLPKLRKKACDGNALISNFLHSQPHQTVEEGEDDFEESKSRKGSQTKQTKVQRAAKKTTTKAPKRSKNQSDIRKVFKKYKNDHEVLHELLKEHSASEQIDPEQLQIALAMSRSLADQEECSSNPTTSGEALGTDCSAASSSGSSEERRIVSIRTTLEQFGFRCKNSYTDYDLNVIFGSASTKNVKRIKHKRATNLLPRSSEELAAFIDSQAKKLFPLEMREMNEGQSTSRVWDSIQSHLNNLFWIAQTELPSEQLMEKYYVPELLEVNPAPVGCMLKDWSKIPGRESTPDRENGAKPVEDTCTRMNSPDLFNDSETGDNAEDCDPIEVQLLSGPFVEKTDQTENEDRNAALADNVVVILSSNESGGVKLAEDAGVLQDDANEQCIDAKQQAMESSNPSTCETDQIPVEEEIVKERTEVVELDDNTEEDEDKFVTASEMSQCPPPAFHRSSENIFDDSDPNPMVSFEVYSSEEEKISAASQVPVGTTSSNGDVATTNKASGDMVQKEQSGKCNKLEQNDGNCLNMPVGEETVEKDRNSCARDEVRFSAEKDLSFHRLAIKVRLSEAMEGMASTVETVDLIEDAPAIDKPAPNLEEMGVNRPTETQCSQLNGTQDDDVLYISDDEVNYSIRGESSRIPARGAESADEEDSDQPREDPDMTIHYHVVEPFEQSRESLNVSPPTSECVLPAEEEPEIAIISSNDDETIVGGINHGENTFAYLDHLVKEFNLPPLKSKQSIKNGLSKSEIGRSNSQPIVASATLSPKESNQAIVLESFGTEVTGEKEENTETHRDVGKVSSNHVPEISDELCNYLHNYEEPNFDDHAIEAEMIASQSPLISNVSAGGKVLGRVKSCTQFDSPSNHTALKRTVSETRLPSSSTPHEKDASKQSKRDNFGNKFNELESATVGMAPTEYVISTSPENQKPPAYEDMSTPEIERELFKYGLKALQRSKAIRVLNYLFDAMHPYVMLVERENERNVPVAPKEHARCTAEETTEQQQKQISTPCSSIALKTPRKCAFKLDLTVTDCFLPSKPRKKVQ